MTLPDTTTHSIPLARPNITEAEIAAVAEVLRSGQLSLGPKLEEFENAFASYCGTHHAVACSSGTAGLHLLVVKEPVHLQVQMIPVEMLRFKAGPSTAEGDATETPN